MITIDDIAKELGIAKSTVSNAISGKRYVSPELKEKILNKCGELKFKPNFFATNLSTGKTNIIGLFLQTGDKPQYMDFYNALIKVCLERAQSYKMNLLIYYGLSEDQTMELVECGKAPIDGAILLSPRIIDERMSSLESNAIPCVVIGKSEPEINNFSYVDIDNSEVIKGLVTKLVEYGHRRIVLINSEKGLTISTEREKAFIETCKKYKISREESYVINATYSTVEEGYEICSRLLEEEPFTAIITANDLLAKGCYESLIDNDLEVGKNISIACLGGELYIKDKLEPKLTYAYQDYKEIGRYATELLVDKVNNSDSSSKKVILKSKVFYTESVQKI